MNAITFYLVLFWGSYEPGLRQEHHAGLPAACASRHAQKTGYTKLLELTVRESMMTYAVNCVTGTCPTPPPQISVREINCVYKQPSVTVQEFKDPGGWVEDKP